MRWVAILLLASAGCLAPAADLQTASWGALVVDGLSAEQAARWNGTTLRADPDLALVATMAACWAEVPGCEEPPVPCGSANCERREFEIGADVASVTLTVRWPTVPAQFDAWIEDASGAILAVAPHRY